jgi:antitoxin ParD1/3/4
MPLEGLKAMPTKNISLTKHFDQFVDDTVRKGAYQNASEVVRDALRLLQAKQQEDELKLENLRKAAAIGFADIEHGRYSTLSSKEDIRRAMTKIGREAVKEAKRKR